MSYSTFRRSEPHVEDVTAARVGSVVTTRERASGRMESYKLVLESEADPSCGLLSVESSLGRALLGKGKGERVRAPLRGAEHEMEIVEVRRWPHLPATEL